MMDKSNNRAFQQMEKPALERLEGRTAQDIAEKSAISFDVEKSVFQLTTLNQEVTVTYPEYQITPTLEQWHHLILLHYLDNADGTLPGDKLMTFAQSKDGMVRGGGFDRQCEQDIGLILGKASPEVLQKACESLGGKILPSNADLCVEFPFLPLYPVTLKIWFADDEFPASGRMFLNETADHFLSVEDAVTVGSIILTGIKSYI